MTCREAKTTSHGRSGRQRRREVNPRTLYEGVGSVKRHGWRTGRGLVLFLLRGSFSLSCISTKARCVNRAVETGSTNHLFGHVVPTMIRFSDAAIARGSKAPNQASDGVAATRVPPGLPCLRTSCA